MNVSQGAKSNPVNAVAIVCRGSYQKLAAQIQRVREHLRRELRGTMEVPERLVRLALNEAEALAWQTQYPHLVFPTLATEKIQAAGAWNSRQKILLHKNSIHATSI